MQYFSNFRTPKPSLENDNDVSNDNRIKITNTYVLYIPLSEGKSIDSVNWNELAKRFGFQIIRERKTQATVEANPDQVTRLHESYPELGITLRQQYKPSFS